MDINIEAKINHYTKEAYRFLLRFQDIRFAGQMVFVVIVLLISWSGVKAIETNYRLQQQISVLQQQTDVQQLKNTNLKLQKEYYQTEQYKELSARQHFGLAAPGETVLIVPKDVALRYTADLPKEQTTAETPTTKQSRFGQNYQAWINFFMHRPATN